MSSCSNTRELRRLVSELYKMFNSEHTFDNDDFLELIDNISEHIDNIEDVRDCEN